jgi:putative molybdopterin biosynthesis protein
MTDADRNYFLEDVPLDEARGRLEAALIAAGKWDALPGESVALADALGRVTAEPVWAKQSSPHYHAAGMDGYAVRAADTLAATETRPLRLRLDEQAFAVDTGDPLPPGTNAVIMIEHAQRLGAGDIAIRASVAPWQHVRLLGEDMVATELVLPVNHRLRPVDLGALAGCGHTTVSVRRAPRVVLIPTGDELVPPGTTPAPGQIVEYNSLVLSAQITTAGGQAATLPIVPDDRDRLRAALAEAIAQGPDLILLLSGSSAGSQDFTASIIREMGEVLVHGVAVRPGHPVIMGMVAAIPVIGVPGYPVSAALTGELFIEPLLARWQGVQPTHDQLPRAQATVTRALVSPMGDDDFVRVTVAEVDGRLLASPLGRGAGVISSLVRADGLALIPRFSEGIEQGGAVNVLLYRPPEHIRKTVLIMGSHDPMIDLWGQFLTVSLPGYRLASAHVGSMGGLAALRRGEAHLAGIHLLDPDTGEYNLAYVQKYLPGEPARLVTFAHREQGFMVAPGNPLNIQSFDDLPRVRYINRQRGAGTRVLLDYELAKRGISSAAIDGYGREEPTHLAVAAAVASGIADCGLGVRSGAVALGLDFVPVGWERYDLVIPERHVERPGVSQLLALLTDARFLQALAAQPGYDIRETGRQRM